MAGVASLEMAGRASALRPFATDDGRWRLPVASTDLDPRFLAMLKACEDARFERHAGVDPVALARAGAQVLRHRRIVSGGSTLTMQVARLLEPRDERNLSAKLRQLVRAVQLERRFSKPEILGLYLTLKFKSGMPMPNAMVCHITEGELLVHQDGRTITAPTFYVWTCNKGTDEWVENKGTVRSVMRITDLKA